MISPLFGLISKQTRVFLTTNPVFEMISNQLLQLDDLKWPVSMTEKILHFH